MRIGQFSSKSINNYGLSGDKLPSQLKLMEFGRTDTLDNPIFITDSSLKCFNDNQSKNGKNQVAIDFEHNSVEGSVNYKGDPCSIAGYGTPIIGKDGLYITDITWTPEGEKYARNYIDLSPAPFLDETNTVIGLHSVALTKAGAIKDLHFYSAANSVITNKQNNMIEDNKVVVAQQAEASNEEKQPVNLVEGLKLKYPTHANLSDEEIKKRILEAYEAKFGVSPETKREGPIVNAEEIKEEPMAKVYSAQITNLENRLAVLEREKDQAVRDAVVKSAVAEGKIIPLSADALKSVSTPVLIDMVKNLQSNKLMTKASVKPFSSQNKTEKSNLKTVAGKFDEMIASLNK
jgi:phage I-like protein